MTCTIDGCDRSDIKSRGMCRLHYRRVERHGDPHIDDIRKAPPPGTGCVQRANNAGRYRCGLPVHADDMCHDHHWARMWPLPLPEIPDEPADEWRQRAACRDHPEPDGFYPVGKGVLPSPAAIAACAGCEVRGDCLAVALATPYGEDFGMWGGTSPNMRADLRRRLGVTPVPHHRHVQPCGTAAGHARHLRDGERPCRACKDARAEARRCA